MSDNQVIPEAAVEVSEWEQCDVCWHSYRDHANGDGCFANPDDYYGHGDPGCPCDQFQLPGPLHMSPRG